MKVPRLEFVQQHADFLYFIRSSKLDEKVIVQGDYLKNKPEMLFACIQEHLEEFKYKTTNLGIHKRL